MILFEYKLTSRAFKQLQKLDPRSQKRIFKKLDFYCSKANPLHYAERISNLRIGQFRFRIGDYRVIFDMRDEELLILAIGHRREIYR